MTITLDSLALTVLGLEETKSPVAIFNDIWESGAYKQTITVFGSVKRWSLSCVEKDIAWANSAANHLQGHANDGASLSFSVSEGDLHTVSTNVKVLRVSVRYAEIGTANVRYFSLELQEV